MTYIQWCSISTPYPETRSSRCPLHESWNTYFLLCVLRNLDDADGLLATFERFGNKPSAFSAEDRIWLLDFPDYVTKAIVLVTSNKQDLLKKTAEPARELTSSKIGLLKSRY